jgi:hypothetical protein
MVRFIKKLNLSLLLGHPIYYFNIFAMFLSIFDLLRNITGGICYDRKTEAHFIFFLSFKKNIAVTL